MCEKVGTCIVQREPNEFPQLFPQQCINTHPKDRREHSLPWGEEVLEHFINTAIGTLKMCDKSGYFNF